MVKSAVVLLLITARLLTAEVSGNVAKEKITAKEIREDIRRQERVYSTLVNGTSPLKRLQARLETNLELVDVGHIDPRTVRPWKKPELASTAIAIYAGHDTSIAISIGGRIQCVLELERYFNIRYYRLGDRDGEPIKEFTEALRAVQKRCEIEGGGEFPSEFDLGVVVRGEESNNQIAKKAINRMFKVKKWHSIHHHLAHARIGFHASPFDTALIVSYDGGSSDGAFSFYKGSWLGVEPLGKSGYNMGGKYNWLASILPEVTGNSLDKLCEAVKSGKDLLGPLFELSPDENAEKYLSWAGKLMGYAATGEATPELSYHIRRFHEEAVPEGYIFNESIEVDNYWDNAELIWLHRFPKQIPRLICEASDPEKMQRNVAATIQKEFELMSYNIVEELLELVGAHHVKGIVLTGGCALNVLANQLIHDRLVRRISEIQIGKHVTGIHVSPAPHDGGLSVGGIWDVLPPTTPQPLQYLGFRLWDEDSLEGIAEARGAVRLSELGGVEYLASLMTNGTAGKKPIVAVVRGRQEYGPRALGHRSLLAVPDSDAIRDRMNRLKVRQWYRPVAPMIADEYLEQAFGRHVPSPYMTMAPRLTEETRKNFPALAHLDGTARHQSVGKDDEPWIHALLMAIGKITGLGSLINTSFNTRGRPIINFVKESLKLLDDLEDLDYVLIEDWLFSKTEKKKSEKASKAEL